jgi:hypothetical protein
MLNCGVGEDNTELELTELAVTPGTTVGDELEDMEETGELVRRLAESDRSVDDDESMEVGELPSDEEPADEEGTIEIEELLDVFGTAGRKMTVAKMLPGALPRVSVEN